MISEFSSAVVCTAFRVVAEVPEVELAVGRRLRAWEKRLRRAPEAAVVRGTGWRDAMGLRQFANKWQ